MKTALLALITFLLFTAFFRLLTQLHPVVGLIAALGVLVVAFYSTYMNWGGILLSMGKVNQAHRVLDAKIRRNPRNALAHAQRATVKFVLGDNDGALADYETALELDIARLEKWAVNKGIEATIHTERGQVYFAQENYQKALEALELARQLKPSFHPTVAWLAITHYALNNVEEASRLWNIACKNFLVIEP